MKEKEILQSAYDYFLKILSETSEEEVGFLPEFLSQKIYEYLVDVCGFNGLPKIVSNERFEANPSIPIFHGFKKFEHGAEYLGDKDYHHGIGWTRGFFLTDKFKEAVTYTSFDNDNCLDDEKKVVKAKLVTGKIIDSEDLTVGQDAALNGYLKLLCEPSEEVSSKIEIFNSFVASIKSAYLKDLFMDSFVRVKSNLAVYLGFDVLLSKPKFRNTSRGNYYVVLNRSALSVPKTEFDRFNNKSRRSKNSQSVSQKGEV